MAGKRILNVIVAGASCRMEITSGGESEQLASPSCENLRILIS